MSAWSAVDAASGRVALAGFITTTATFGGVDLVGAGDGNSDVVVNGQVIPQVKKQRPPRCMDVANRDVRAGWAPQAA